MYLCSRVVNFISKTGRCVLGTEGDISHESPILQLFLECALYTLLTSISRSINRALFPLSPAIKTFISQSHSRPLQPPLKSTTRKMHFSLVALAPLFLIASAAPAIVARDGDYKQSRLCPSLPVRDGGCIRCNPLLY